MRWSMQYNSKLKPIAIPNSGTLHASNVVEESGGRKGDGGGGDGGGGGGGGGSGAGDGGRGGRGGGSDSVGGGGEGGWFDVLHTFAPTAFYEHSSHMHDKKHVVKIPSFSFVCTAHESICEEKRNSSSSSLREKMPSSFFKYSFLKCVCVCLLPEDLFFFLLSFGRK